jgi:hypothetical protein
VPEPSISRRTLDLRRVARRPSLRLQATTSIAQKGDEWKLHGHFHQKSWNSLSILFSGEVRKRAKNNNTKINDQNINSMETERRKIQKDDPGGIRTHAQKTAALTQRLRPLGHRVTYTKGELIKHLNNLFNVTDILSASPSFFIRD